MPTQADFWREIFEAGKAAQLYQQSLDPIRRASNEKVDAFGAQKNRAFEGLLSAKPDEALTERLQIAEFSKAVGGDVGDLL
jgi:hypothetical protein